MKLLPQLSNKLTTYDATEKKTVPPEQSTAAIRADIAALGMYLPFGVLPLESQPTFLSLWLPATFLSLLFFVSFYTIHPRPHHPHNKHYHTNAINNSFLSIPLSIQQAKKKQNRPRSIRLVRPLRPHRSPPQYFHTNAINNAFPFSSLNATPQQA